MGRYNGPVCRLCRREGIKLMLKGARCESAKCAMERQWRNSPPGMHSWRRGRQSEYGLRLREVQKVKRYYGLFHRQFMLTFRDAERIQGNTGEIFLQLLERRLDNVAYKMGLAPSRKSARMMISHGHLLVNGRKVDIASYQVRSGDTLTVKDAERSRAYVKAEMELAGGITPQPWLSFDPSQLTGKVLAMPTRDDVQIPVEEQLIVELCSK
ncbi:MAG: 30S ribosomal protein S4 [Phycisphaerae bacterium]|nr:30S ribosomal protein S4 [Phycisphaerae bacterium]